VRIYVAGRTNDIKRVREMQDLCRKAGHEITEDWTQNVNAQAIRAEDDGVTLPSEFKRYAMNDVRGVRSADMIVVMCGPALLGTAIEIGIAIEREIPVVLVGETDRDSVFFYLPNVVRFESAWAVYRFIKP
jgi:nucleoside 2-deoxyribosyltransferase